MSILYNFRKMLPRPDQNEPEEAEGRLFAQAIIQRQYTTEDLCRDISDRSSFSSGDITGLMIAMEELIFEYLASGYSFRLGNIGTLSAKVKSRGVRDKKEIRSGSVQAVDINFRSTPQAKRRMRSMSVKRGPSFGQSCPKADEEELSLGGRAHPPQRIHSDSRVQHTIRPAQTQCYKGTEPLGARR